MSIEVSHLKKSFNQAERKLNIIKDINFLVKDSEIVAILGQSGSGKTTLLGMISGLEKPDEGKILIGQQDMTNLNENEWSKFRAKNLGIVFQQYHLIPHLTALENVALPLEISGRSFASSVEIAKQFIAEVGLVDRMNHLPSQLSGGESQRIAIARALAVEPKLCLADEPSGNLDVATGELVMDFLFKAVRNHGTSTLLVTHNLELAKKCDRTLRLVDGILTEVR